MRAAAALLLLAGPATALPVAPPEGAVTTLAEAAAAGTYPLPLGPFGPAYRPVRLLEGDVERQVWRIDRVEADSLAILRGLEAAAVALGYVRRFDCQTEACGGFDFRYGLPLAGAPEMEVDLGDFQFVALEAPGGAHLMFLASRAGLSVFVEAVAVQERPILPGEVRTDPQPVPPPAPVVPAPVTSAAPSPPAAPVTATPAPAPAPAPATALAAELREAGRAVLPGVDFASGSAEMVAGSEAAIAELAAMLTADPALRVIVVGHTDASGGLVGNLALSRARALAVVDVLKRRHGVPAERVSGEGVGPLAPRAANLTPEGRALNRRVEVVALP